MADRTASLVQAAQPLLELVVCRIQRRVLVGGMRLHPNERRTRAGQFDLVRAIVLPWDREILVDGELSPNPKYDGLA
mgnify:CR=1 FL=1